MAKILVQTNKEIQRPIADILEAYDLTLRIVEKQPGKWTAWISGLRYHRYSTNDTSLCVVEDTQDAALVSLCKELTGREVHIPNPKKGWFESPFIVLDLSLTIVIPVDVS